MSNQDMSSRASVSLGIALLAAGAFFLYFASHIKASGLAGNGDPGPRAIPVTLSILLMLGGIVELGASTVSGHAPRADGPQGKAWTQPGNIRVVVFTIILLGYLITVPFAFYTSTFLFGALAIWYLGARWWVACFMSAAIAIVVWVLFVRLFLVPLPTLLETISSYWRTS